MPISLILCWVLVSSKTVMLSPSATLMTLPSRISACTYNIRHSASMVAAVLNLLVVFKRGIYSARGIGCGFQHDKPPGFTAPHLPTSRTRTTGILCVSSSANRMNRFPVAKRETLLPTYPSQPRCSRMA